MMVHLDLSLAKNEATIYCSIHSIDSLLTADHQKGGQDENGSNLRQVEFNVQKGNDDRVGARCLAKSEKRLFVLRVKYLGWQEKRVKSAKAVCHVLFVLGLAKKGGFLFFSD